MDYRDVKDLSGDGVVRYITSILWRTNSKGDIARPIFLYLLGFDVFAFGTKGIVNDKRKGARTVYDIEPNKIKFFRRKTLLIEYGQDITEKCFCPIHNGISMDSSILPIYNSECGAVLASTHDMHRISEFFEDIKLGKINKRKVLKKKVYSELLTRIMQVR